MFCPHCGKFIPVESAFCPECGDPVSGHTMNNSGTSPDSLRPYQSMTIPIQRNVLYTPRLIINILSLVLFVLILFQSCAAGVISTFIDEESVSGSVGALLAFCMLIAGIVGICTRYSTENTGRYITGGLYALGGLMGLGDVGIYEDLELWSILSFLFAICFFWPNTKK